VLAADYYGRLLSLLDDADAEMQPLVTRARAALDRLSREQKPRS